MQGEVLVHLFAMVFFFAALVITVYVRRTKLIEIKDFQVGLRFRKSGSYKTLPPGCYRTGAGLDPIGVLDMRPHQFIVERINFQDVLLANAMISVGGELVVSDPSVAFNTFKNLAEDSLAIVREHLRPAASRSVVEPGQEGKEKLAVTITSEINRTLQTSGVMIRNLEITELWIQPVKYELATEAN